MLTLTNRIDMRPGAVPLVIHLGQYDSDFSLVFELYSSAGNFTVESGTTAMIRGTKTDGNAYDADATIDVSAKTVTVAGSEQMTAAKGRNVYELVLTKSGKVLSTANFILDVERAAMDANTIASESVLKELNAIIDSAATSTQAAADAAAAADRAEDAADSVSSASAQIATNTADISDLKADLSESVGELKNAFGNNFSVGINLIPTETDGKFVDASNNNVSSSDNFALLGPIPVKRGQHIVFNARGYSTVVGMICTCNADNTERQTVVRSIDGTKREYTYDVLSDGFIVLSYVKSDRYELNATIDYYSYINALNQLEPVFAGSQNKPIFPILNGFIDPTTNRYNASNSFKTSDSVKLFKGQTINFTATGYLANVGMINLYDKNTDTYQSVARSIDSTEHLYTYTAVTDCVVRLCYLAGTTATAVIITPQDDFARIVNLETDVANLQTPVAYPQLFDNVLCIGDSLTVGASGNGNEILTKNYPHFLRKLTVAETTIKGHGGYSAKQVWDEYISISTDLSSYDCAIIYLGTNGGLTDTVETDCNTSDYTQNADTNTGCYGKIIGKIKADAPNCKIFCIAGPAENIRRDETMNPAVRELASFYNVGLLDLENSILSDDGSVGSQKRYTYRPVDAIHYNALGYLTLANLIGDGIHDYVSANLIKFA